MKVNRSKLLRRALMILLLIGILGVFVAHRVVRQYGFDGIGEFISVYRHNKNLADQVEPKSLQLLIDDADYEFLKNRRDKAMERGIQINDGEDNYVPCKVIADGDTVKGEIRLKGHMTDHLEGEKWSFRVKTKKNPVFGMTRFSLQEPGTRNYAYEWIYHQLLKQEGIIHLNYDFIHLKLNEKDLGIYAIEEHFGQHVLDHNKRPDGAILRWNPNLYWEWRIDELQGTYLNEQYSQYASSFVEPYEKGTVEDDPKLVETYQKGAELLEAFRRGEKKTSEVFDVKLMARFHAIIDLVGGHHSLDWSDVKFFYNSETGLIEPVGYESFSVRKTESIAGQRTPDTYDPVQMNYHNQLFSDPVFFAAYIRELERICDEKYFHAFIQTIQSELNQKLGILAHDYPYLQFSFDPYFENIDLIRHNIQLPKAFHAFIEEETDSTVQISLTPVSDFPIEVLSLTVDEKKEYQLDSVFVLHAKARNTYAHYFLIEVKHDAKKLKNLKLKARIPGSSSVFMVEVSDLPSYDRQPKNYSIAMPVYKGTELSLLNDSVAFFNSKDIVIDGTLAWFDSTTKIVFFPGQHVHFKDNGMILTSGRVEMLGGSEDGEEIRVTSDPTDPARNAEFPEMHYSIILAGGKLTCNNVHFTSANNFLKASGAAVLFDQCLFADIDSSFMNVYKSDVLLTDCASGRMACLGEFDRSMVRVKSFDAKNGEVFLQAYGTDVDMMTCNLSNYNSIAKLDYSSGLSAWSSYFSAKEQIAILSNASFLRMFSGEISNTPRAILRQNSQPMPGESFYEFQKTKQTNIGQIE